MFLTRGRTKLTLNFIVDQNWLDFFVALVKCAFYQLILSYHATTVITVTIRISVMIADVFILTKVLVNV